MKSAMAYTSGLYVSDPSRKQAEAAFARKEAMTPDDFRTVRDFAFRHVLMACKRNSFPVVIHTGYQIWGHSNLDQANPLLLHNLLIDPRYKDISFVLLHGGQPYVGETAYLAGLWPNVYIDFTWISWMTPARFKLGLAEWLAEVPHHKFCWGSDSGCPESIAGVGGFTRRMIADVLEECIADRIIDEKYALEFIENTYLNTPKRLFGL
jgi:predicted TIM-barrel fold metal-dependent hydrolase